MAKPLIIYGRVLSPFTARVMLAAQAKGFAYEVGVPEGGIKTPQYLALNPLGKVPVLKDGKTTLYESSVIVDYLDAKSPKRKLLPRAAKAAAQARLVAAVAAEYVQPPTLKLFRHKRGTLTESLNIEETLADLDKGLSALAQLMPKGKYAAGSKFGFADCFVAPALMFGASAIEAMGLGDRLRAYPKLAKYFAAIQKDKIAKQILADMQGSFRQALAGQVPPLR